MTDAVVVDGVSRWFRDRVAVADVSFAAGPGVTACSGTTAPARRPILRLLAGFTSPSRGSVRILGADPRREPEVFRRVGLVPDGDGLWPFLTAHGAVALLARLRGVADPTPPRIVRSRPSASTRSPTGGWPGSRRACGRA